MVGQLFVSVVVLLAPVVCLCIAWRLRASDGESPAMAALRGKITHFGLIAASIAMFLNGTFLLHGVAQGRAGFLGPPDEPWLAMNIVATVLWAIAILASAFGTGRPRIALAVWSLLAFIADYIIITLAMD